MSKWDFVVKIFLYFGNGAIGEVVNTLVCGTSMQEFDSLMTPHVSILKLISLGLWVFLFLINLIRRVSFSELLLSIDKTPLLETVGKFADALEIDIRQLFDNSN